MAAAQEITLEVATPLGMALQEQTQSVQIPSASGQFGVLPGHVPLLAALRPGVMTYHKDGKPFRTAIGWGFVEAGAANVRLITEFFVTAESVDVAVAKKDREAAEQRLKELDGQLGDTAHVEAQRALDWALARIELANTTGN